MKKIISEVEKSNEFANYIKQELEQIGVDFKYSRNINYKSYDIMPCVYADQKYSNGLIRMHFYPIYSLNTSLFNEVLEFLKYNFDTEDQNFCFVDRGGSFIIQVDRGNFLRDKNIEKILWNEN